MQQLRSCGSLGSDISTHELQTLQNFKFRGHSEDFQAQS